MLEILCESKEYERVKCFDSFPFRSLYHARALSLSFSLSDCALCEFSGWGPENFLS